MAPFDQTKWYTIGFQGNSSYSYDSARNTMTGEGVGSPTWAQSVKDLPQQLWQLWPVDKTGYYLVRCAGAGSDMFLSGWGTEDPTTKVGGGAVLKNPLRYPNDQGMLWNISSWGGDNTWYSMANKANGTNLRLSSAMSANFGAFFEDTTSPDSQNQLTLASQGPADWYGFQTMNTPAVAKSFATPTFTSSATSMTAAPTGAGIISSPTATLSTCSDVAAPSISPGASAGIAVGVTAVVCAGIFAVAWILMSRRLRQQLRPNNGAAEVSSYQNAGPSKEFATSTTYAAPTYASSQPGELSGASTRPNVSELASHH